MSHQTRVAELSTAIGYVFSPEFQELAWAALQWNNGELANLGKKILGLIIAMDEQAAGKPKGGMDAAVCSAGSNATLEQVARTFGLDRFVVPHPSRRFEKEIMPKTLTETLEAILWAVFVSSGQKLSAVKDVMNNIGVWPTRPQQQQ